LAIAIKVQVQSGQVDILHRQPEPGKREAVPTWLNQPHSIKVSYLHPWQSPHRWQMGEESSKAY